ncbi:hypothetical protein SSX86_029842 [Deinandra increscens subsp. villosa]|uniref:Protein FAR1-RELATED SEQUENCE n=1 Tax=Deinandra increscens subsp. villosa TaxID=3103831 RepID=A0AAP0CFU9_9ASTR
MSTSPVPVSPGPAKDSVIETSNLADINHPQPVDQLSFREIDSGGCISSKVFASPNGTMLWKPDVPTEFKPIIGVVFDSWSDALKMYNDYADKLQGEVLDTTDIRAGIKKLVWNKMILLSHKRCLTHTSTEADGNMQYTVSQFNKKRKIVANFEVKFDPIDKSASCTCMCFTRVGYLCRHIFAVYSFNEVDEIPDRYVLKRWRRGALPKSSSSDTVIVAPEAVKHKGRHSDARIVGEREKAIEQHKKVQRKCTTCGRPGHNARS